MTTATETPTAALPDALSAGARAFISQSHHLLIGSERPEAADGRTFATLDPATGREIAQVAQAGERDVERAVASAREAFAEGPWASLPPAGREGLMLALAEAIEEHAEELAQIESLDNGKPVRLARYVDVAGTVAHLRYFAPAGRRRSRAACCRSRRRTCSATPAASRSACARRSSPGTSRC